MIYMIIVIFVLCLCFPNYFIEGNSGCGNQEEYCASTPKRQRLGKKGLTQGGFGGKFSPPLPNSNVSSQISL